MTELLNYLNSNPALLSILAFPLGLLLLGMMAKFLGIGTLIKTLNEHVSAEMKIEARLTEIVIELRNILTYNLNTHKVWEEKMKYFGERFDRLDRGILELLSTGKRLHDQRSQDPD